MTTARGSLAWLIVAIAVTSSCAGDGTGLVREPLGSTLSSIQDNIFDPICTQCHTGVSAPLGLVLDRGLARQYLVEVPSVEMSDMVRVRPGEPDLSYVMWKIEGRREIQGGRMPLGLPPLSTEQIAAIRRWIEDGAQDN
jgi:hypothetical protein